MPTALPRSKVKKDQTWNSESVFESPEAFDAEVKSLVESLAEVRKFQGRLGESPDIFLETMDLIETISRRAAKVRVYASMS
ncbi:MAG: oligoendopeptidase F, partial [Anaerolineales bacterium]